MFLISDVFDEAKKISGICDQEKILKWLTDACSLTANKADLEGWKGTLDICTSSCGNFVTLPREVGTIYAVNIGGHPTLGLHELFRYHLNGSGDCCQSCGYTWQDLGGAHAVYRDLPVPAKLVAYVQRPEDTGKKLTVFGYDVDGHSLSTISSTGRTAGYDVPTVFSYAIPDNVAPVVARITAVVKQETIGDIRLSTIDDGGPNGVLLAVYEGPETIPNYRRIKLSRSCGWVRIAYRRVNPEFTSLADRVPLKSRLGFLMAMRATKFYFEADVANAHAFEADAARLELEAQFAQDPPTYMPVQVLENAAAINDRSDFDIR